MNATKLAGSKLVLLIAVVGVVAVAADQALAGHPRVGGGRRSSSSCSSRTVVNRQVTIYLCSSCGQVIQAHPAQRRVVIVRPLLLRRTVTHGAQGRRALVRKSSRSRARYLHGTGKGSSRGGGMISYQKSRSRGSGLSFTIRF